MRHAQFQGDDNHFASMDNHNFANDLIIIIRSGLFQLYLIIGTLIIGIAGLPVFFMDADRRRDYCQFWCRAMLWGLRHICGIKTKFNGLENLTPDGAVIAANHQSMWETIQIFAILKKPVMVLKEELLAIPVFGSWLRASGCIAIDRSAGPRAMRKLIEDAKASTRDGGQIIIFPEGTRSKPSSKAPLKPGIAGIYSSANVACLAIGHDSGRFWVYPGFRKNPGSITMNIAPLIPAGEPRKSFMTHLETVLLNIRPDL